MATAPNVVLYGSGLFGSNNPTLNASQLGLIKNSGFTTVILWTLHVDSDASLVYNNTAIATGGVFSYTFSYLPELVRELKDGGTVDKVLFCVGSADVNDFHTIQTLLKTQATKLALLRNFFALSTALMLDGYDFDDEDLFDPTTTAAITGLLASSGKMNITYCPYSQQKTYWDKALGLVYNNHPQYEPPRQYVDWYNLQCYAGGGGNDPKTWVDRLPTDVGITSPSQFIVPGYDARSYDPAAIETKFANLKTSDPGINGGFIWNTDELFAGSHKPTDYAQAIIAGLAGT